MSAAPASASRLVILSGSPKPTGSTSAILGARLAQLMAPKGKLRDQPYRRED